MKTHPTRRKSGFTLVELLVVIAIIAVLAGAGFAAGNAAIQKARKTTALAACTAIDQAVSQFYAEYGAMPTKDTTSGETDAPALDTKTDKEFLNILLGLNETANPPLNTRANKFLSVKEGKKKGTTDGTNGIIYNADGKTVLGLFDPWGGTYKVILDTGYDERVMPAPKGGGGPVNPLNGRHSATWSDGADGVGAAAGNAADDVKTW
ncbi:MAG: type II secretion system protein [Luteolibacter sp.]|uniref:type II secretion system protein n=1 Tax=Luteolibacter sp. TaxID=1962973 RepID=UPI00326467D4